MARRRGFDEGVARVVDASRRRLRRGARDFPLRQRGGQRVQNLRLRRFRVTHQKHVHARGEASHGGVPEAEGSHGAHLHVVGHDESIETFVASERADYGGGGGRGNGTRAGGFHGGDEEVCDEDGGDVRGDGVAEGAHLDVAESSEVVG